MIPSNPTSRHDPYRNIHKGLRAAMFDAIHRLGRMDVAHSAEVQAALDQVDSLLALMAAHIKHENDHMHTAIEARHPGGARRASDGHADHLESLACLRDLTAGLRGAAPEARAYLAHQLYLELAEFAAENLAHMRVEETQNNRLLWSLYSDDEVVAIHDRLLASVEPGILMEAIGWMARGLSLPELVELLGDIRRKAPAQAYQAVLAQVRRQVDAARWSLLSHQLEAATPAAA